MKDKLEMANCKFYRQHYSYSEKRGHVFQVACGHCLKGKRNCQNCKFYESQEIKLDDAWFSIKLQLDRIKNQIDMLEKELQDSPFLK